MRRARDPTGVDDESGSIARRRATVDAFLAAMRGGGDFGALLTDDVALTVMETAEVRRDRAAVAALLDHLHRRAFAAEPTPATVVVDEHQAMIEAEFVATHVGEFAGIAPTGRRVRIPYAVACDLDGDAIAALRLYLPLDALVRQLRD